MNPERWQRIKELFHRALEMGAAERGAFLEAECAGDAELRAEVESLVAADARGEDFLDEGAAGVAAGVVESVAELEAGRRVGPYTVVSTLGEGGMGKVYLAEDARLGRRVALKLLPPSFVIDRERVRRFEQEARAASALNHPNILTIHEIGSDRGLRFIATEFVEGSTLREHLRRGPLRLNEVLELGIQLAAALSAAHAARVVHRDVKPENVIVRPDGYVKILDFGLAKPAREGGPLAADSGSQARSLVSTQPGMIMGTARYMSPEQARGLETDERTDVWSLGVVLYECVAGRAPFDGPTNSDVMAAVLNREPPPLARAASDVPAELERIVTKALAKDRDERYQTAKDLGIDLRRLKQRLEFEAEMGRGETRETAETGAAGDASRAREPHAAPRQSRANVAPAPAEQIKQVTILFADIGGLAARTETLDAEESGELMDALWRRVDAAVMDNGGRVDRRMGDQSMALWGERVAREDDPAHAVRAALAIRRAVAESVAENPNEAVSDDDAGGLVRVGVNTGAVLLTTAGAGGELTATGAAVNVARRLGQAAPPGGVLVSHDTYRHVRGLFDVRETELASVRGAGEPVRAYLVEREKPRAFRLRARGVEGVETRMVGRQSELARLRDALQTVIEDRELQVLTVVGDAGLGKSRLLDEFSSEVELLPAQVATFNGRAGQWARGLPFALVRDVFGLHFGIQDSDEPRVAREKFERGMLECFDDEDALMRAHFVGHLMGFDFSASPHLAGILHDAKQVRGRAFHYASEFFRRVARRKPALLLLDDLHWADDGSLDFVDHLTRECPNCPLLVVCAARPDLIERRPEWGEGLHTHARLAIQPLTRRESRQLVEEILRHAQAIPHALRELVVSAAEGNPFYVEELIKMLIDQKVIVASPDRWRVDASRLVEVRVPQTLTGVLQARLDGLTEWEKTVLQRASVIGREFWDGALEKFSRSAVERRGEGREGDTASALEALRRKELVYRREASGFTGAREYVFKHALLRSVAYENVLKRERRRLHREAAAWLVEQAGARVEEYAAVIAEHFELSKESALAAEWLGRAGRQARASYAPEAAIDFYTKAIEHLNALPVPGADATALRAQAIEWHAGLGEVLTMQARYVEAEQAYARMREAAESRGDLIAQARAWNGLTAVREYQGDNRGALRSARRAEELTREAAAASQGPEAEEAKAELAVALNRQGLASHRLGDAAAVARLGEQILALCDEMRGDSRGARANGLKLLGVAHEVSGRFEEAQECFESSLLLLKKLGDRRNFGFMLNNLGVIAHLRADYAAAVRRYEEALAIFREIGERTWELPTLGNLAGARIGLEEYAAAEKNLRQAIALTGPAGHFALSMIYCYLAESFWGQGALDDALETALKALELGQATENQDYIANAWRTLGLVASRRGGVINVGGSEHDAAVCFGKSLRVYTDMGAEAERARTLRDWSRHEHSRGKPEEAVRMRREAREIFTRLRMTHELELLSPEDGEA